MKLGLPRTAIAVLDAIIPEAVADEAYAEATKAICLQISVEGWFLDSGEYGQMIVSLETAIATPCVFRRT